MRRIILTVTGKDQPGIIAGVTKCLFDQGCNLEDVSMTILEGEFAMMMVVCVRREKKIKIMRESVQRFASRRRLTFYWKDLGQKTLQRGAKHGSRSEAYLVRAAGPDRTGIVHRVSGLLAVLGLNITDLESRIIGRDPRAVYVLLLEVDIPKRFDVRKVERGLKRLEKKLGIEIQLRALENIAI